MADDGYTTYYADKLWSLLPSIYRTLDPPTDFDPASESAQPAGPLRELVDRIGATAAVLRRSIDRMWEDQSIESCDDWVIPYIAAQLATNLVSGMDARQQRLDVARTLYYRRRKGTLPVLEEIASDVTGWDARVVEMYRRLGRARHGLDPAIGFPLDRTVKDPQGHAQPSPAVFAGLLGANTGTPLGGYADLRRSYGASRARTAFDEFSYTADVRLGSERRGSPDIPHGDGRTGWPGIATLAVFLWRLQSVPVDHVTPVADARSPGHYTFDPTGRDVPLFAAPVVVHDADWIPRHEGQLPGPIDAALLRHALAHLVRPLEAGGAIQIYAGELPVDGVTADPRDAASKYLVDPARGRFVAPAGAPPAGTALEVGYRYGFASSLGAGGYDRRVPGRPPAAATAAPAITGGGSLAAASRASGTVRIGDSRTYTAAPPFAIAGDLVVQAVDGQRPLVRLAPASRGATSWVFTGTTTSCTLVLDGLFVSGGDVVLAGTFDQVTISTCTLDPGSWDATRRAWALAADGRPLVPSRLVVRGAVSNLVIDRSILGPVITSPLTATAAAGSVEAATLTDTIVQAAAPEAKALALATGMTTVQRCTVLGETSLHGVEASDTIFHGVATVADGQRGCVRFSAWTAGSALPRQYRSVQLDPRQPLFAATAFGRPDYAALLPAVDAAVSAGAESGSEMGAFSRESYPLKERSLLIKYQESLPIGVAPVLIYVT